MEDTRAGLKTWPYPTTVPFSVSISGQDNIGKSSQLALLPDHFTVKKVGGLHENDKKVAQLQQQGHLTDWWWNSSSDDFVSTILGAAARRYWNSTGATADSGRELVVFDRGVAMFEAGAVAMIAFKRGDDDLDAARSAFKKITDKLGLVIPYENFAIILRHDAEDIETCVERTMRREDDHPGPPDTRYTHYQRLLQTELLAQEARGLYQHTIRVSETDSYGKVQNMLRAVLLEETSNPLFQPMLHPLQAIYGFSGLSESGKSTLAERFCATLGSRRAFRAKIVYFNSLVSQSIGKSVYGLSEEEQALNLFHELERFARAHYWLRVVTIESLHLAKLTQLLKAWLGDMFQVVFIDVEDSRRLGRSLVTVEELNRNDQMKRERGVELLTREADLVVDNNGTVEASMEALLRHAHARGTPTDGDYEDRPGQSTLVK